MSAPKVIVWIKEAGEWVEQGDGPLTPKQAERIAREIWEDFHVATKILPVGRSPLNSHNQ